VVAGGGIAGVAGEIERPEVEAAALPFGRHGVVRKIYQAKKSERRSRGIALPGKKRIEQVVRASAARIGLKPQRPERAHFATAGVRPVLENRAEDVLRLDLPASVLLGDVKRPRIALGGPRGGAGGQGQNSRQQRPDCNPVVHVWSKRRAIAWWDNEAA